MTAPSVTPITPLKAVTEAGAVFPMVYEARIQRRKRLSSLFSTLTFLS